MAGVYFHIPFCRRKCPYCNFFSLATSKDRDRFISAVVKEIMLSGAYLEDGFIETIYFGGGTPSVYPPTELERLIRALPYRTEAKACSEITLEINPEDVDEAFTEALKRTSFNRFSLGVQSFSEKELHFLGRGHDAAQPVRAVELLRRAGFENISIDLIYGIPGSDDTVWLKNLEIAFSLEVPHISAYALTVEEKTPLAWMIGRRRAEPVDDAQQARQFRLLMQEAERHGYEQYEISNFARPGMHAIHNTNYWQGVPYLGLGPSAHSYNGVSRRWNRSNLKEYMEAMEAGNSCYEEEILTPADRYNEYVMTSLRTMWGCDSRILAGIPGIPPENSLLSKAGAFIEKGWMTVKEGVFFLTPEGKLFADRVTAELFV